MAVNVFTLDMMNEFMPDGGKPWKDDKAVCMRNKPDVIEALYKVFTSGFSSTKTITSTSSIEKYYEAQLSAPISLSPGCLIRVNGKAGRVIENRGNSLVVDTDIGSGNIKVLGLGFKPVSVDGANNKFTVKDRYDNELEFSFLFPLHSAATYQTAKPLIQLKVFGITRTLAWYPNGTPNTQVTVDMILHQTFQSFVSDGNILWYSVSAHFDLKFPAVQGYNTYHMIGAFDDKFFWLPTEEKAHSLNWSTATGTVSGPFGYKMDNFMGRASRPAGPYHKTLNPNANQNETIFLINGMGYFAIPTIALKGSRNSEYVITDNIYFMRYGAYRVPGAAAWCQGKFGTPNSVFEYEGEMLWQGEMYMQGIPHLFYLDSNRWENLNV